MRGTRGPERWQWILPPLMVVLSLLAACGGTGSPRATGVSNPAAPPPATPTGPTSPSPGYAIDVPAYPDHVPAFISPYPVQMRYGGQENVEGSPTVDMTIEAFGVGHPGFVPSILIGTSGQRLRMTIANETPVEHNFSTLDGEIDRDIPIGKTVPVAVTFPKSGVLHFYCKFHLIDLQVGVLSVGQPG